MISKSIYFFFISCLFITCSKKATQPAKPVEETFLAEHFHGYLLIGCETPPYHLNLDSLIKNCASPGILPDSFPLPLMQNADDFTNACGFDNNKDKFGAADNFDIKILHQENTINLESLIPNATSQSIPIEFSGTEYNAGEYPYLGGYQLTTSELELTIQVINEYIGGCFHNAVIWQLTYL